MEMQRARPAAQRPEHGDGIMPGTDRVAGIQAGGEKGAVDPVQRIDHLDQLPGI